MSNGDEYGIDNNETSNSRSSLNIPTHGTIPKWLEDMSNNIIKNHVSNKRQDSPNKFYHLFNLNTLKDGTNIPSHISDRRSFMSVKKSLKPPMNKSTKYGRRSSLTTQLYIQHFPKHLMLTESNYLVPQLNERNLVRLHQDLQQEDLEKSWKGLNEFKQTHKGRLDSAKDGLSDVISDNYEARHSSLASYSETDTNSSYSPSFINRHALPIRSKSEMSNYVPYYVYSNIKKVTESEESSPSHSLNASDLVNSKAKSSEDIYNHFALESQKSKLHTDKALHDLAHENSYSMDEQNHFTKTNIEKHLNDYKLKVDQENRLRERIINELLTENERITERLNHKNVKNKQDIRKTFKSPSFEEVSLHQKLYNKNSKYKSTTHISKFGLHEELKDDNHEKENLIEYYIEGSDLFIIPELPTGKILKIDILSTWGDKHYVGLNGIEIFGDDGRIVGVRKITASPADINVLPENQNDPRIVANLLDGVNRTQDDVHLWLAPFDKRSEHIITIEFKNVSTLAMIRIWNYNKSRIHSFRGVKDIIMTLDDVPIFKGEIAKACGGIMGGVDAFGDTILFTTNDNTLELISQHDKSYSTLTTTAKAETPTAIERPPTVATMADRPYTGAPQLPIHSDNSVSKDQILLGARQLDIILLSNWGYANIIGLTGLEIIGISDNSIHVNEENISCNSKIKTLNLKALFNGENITTDIGNMWWVPYRAGQEVVLTIQFPEFTYVAGIRIWNYNQSTETTYAGARAVRILLDKKPLLNYLTGDEIFLLRRAPGNMHYDFVQDVQFVDTSALSLAENYIQINSSCNSLSLYRNEMPEGFVYQFIIFSTWDDQYYCGLNGIELYNEYNKKIVLEEQNICAYPESINVLPGVCGDIRTPDKLIDGITDDDEGAHSWLAPIIPKCLNRIYVVLDQPVTVSLIKLWNYSKTPSRGIKEFGILVDDLLVYNGILDKSAKKKGRTNYRSIVFTDDKKVLEKEYNTYIRHSSYSQEVILLDENRATTGGSLPNPDQTLRPFTSVSPFDKGYTSH